MDPILERVDEIEEHLLTRAFLYDDPVTYREGIHTALVAIREALRATQAVA